MFMPCSGLTGANLREPIDETVCPWYKGPAFIPYINELPPLSRNINGPFMMPIVDRYNDRGTIVMGKVESGSCKKSDSIIIMPNKVSYCGVKIRCFIRLWKFYFTCTGTIHTLPARCYFNRSIQVVGCVHRDVPSRQLKNYREQKNLIAGRIIFQFALIRGTYFAKPQWQYWHTVVDLLYYNW